jgi:hypothetical protein
MAAVTTAPRNSVCPDRPRIIALPKLLVWLITGL